jgi:hypothetical protein
MGQGSQRAPPHLEGDGSSINLRSLRQAGFKRRVVAAQVNPFESKGLTSGYITFGGLKDQEKFTNRLREG